MRFAAGRLAAALLLAAGCASAGAAPVDTLEQRLKACTPCHGVQGREGRDAYYPRIAGKPEAYLYRQLLNFRDGRRHYAPMTALLDHLPDAYLREIAAYFARQPAPAPAPQPTRHPIEVLEHGRRLATLGDPGRDLPACAACHGSGLEGRAPAIPGLTGLPRDYINAQLGAWRDGLRRADAPDCMATIAHRMTPQDVSAVSAWLSSRPASTGKVDPRSAPPMPMPCGSAPPSETGGAR
jgi:cytochrome c553